MKFRPGSLQWLIAHEARIEWRELLQQRGRGSAIFTVLLIAAGLTFMWTAILGPGFSLFTPVVTPGGQLAAGVFVYALLPVAVLVGINQSVKAVFERNDLDLLLSSPLPVRTVFAGRLLSVAIYVMASLAVFLLPLVLAGLLRGIPRFLGILPLLVAVSVAGAALGMLATLFLVRVAGARRARTYSQVFAVVAGAAAFIAFQLYSFTNRGEDPSAMVERLLPLFQPGGILAADSWLWLPGRAALLDPVSTLVMLAAAALAFWATVGLLHRWFVLGAGETVTGVSRRRARSGPVRFAARNPLWRVMLTKDWRALVRDPYLLSQTLLQTVYLLPLLSIFLLDRDGMREGIDLGPIVAGVLTVLAGSLAGNLARISMAGEEALDLLMAAPIPPRAVRLAKLLAAALPVWLLFIPASLVVMFVDPVPGLLALGGVLASTLGVTYARLQNPHRAPRQDLFRRSGQGDQVYLILESLLPLAIGVAAGLLANAHPGAWIPICIAAGLVFLAVMRGRALGLPYAEPTLDG